MTLAKETLAIRRIVERNSSRDLRRILEAYRDSQRRIQGEIARLTTQNIENGVLSLSQQRRLQLLAQMDRQIVEQARMLGALELERTTAVLSNAFEESYYRTGYMLDKGMPTVTSFARISPQMVEAAVLTPIQGKMFSDRIWKNKENLIIRLRDGLDRTLVDGTDPRTIAREMAQEFGTSAYESRRLVSNEVARVTRQAQDRMYEESAVVNSVMFDATLDDVTSKICQSLDGTVYEIGETKPEIPEGTHVGCRSDYVPIAPGWEPTQKYDNEEKEAIDYVSYPKWRESREL